MELRGVVKRFGDTEAVRGLSFSARRGEVLALLGPNGAGKTTTIEMCEGFTKPTSGSIRVLGLDPHTQTEAVRERIGIMLQGGGSYSGIRVREMLELSASYNADPLDPEWLLEILGLKKVAKTTYRRLSGGQQQRLSLALAIIGRPELVFLDEPTAGMDAQARHKVWELISALRRDGVTIILTTHLMDEAESLADHVVIIDQGQLIAEGTPAELIRGGDAAAVEIVTERPFDLSAAREQGARLFEDGPLRYRLETEPTPQIIAAIAAEAARQDVLIREIGVKDRTLEDVFLDLTGRELRG